MLGTKSRWIGEGRGLLAAGGLGAACLWSVSASAHIELTSPPARYGLDYQKNAPCGPNPATAPAPSGAVTVYQGGETITLSIDEYVGHTGSMRVAIDPTGTDAFQLPTSYDDLQGPNILGAFDDPGGGGAVDLQVTLPDEPCDPCTLQVIQIMEDGSFSNDDFYFQCADIVIEGAAATGGDDTGGVDTGGGSASAGTDGGDDSAGSGGGPDGSTDGGGDDGAADGNADAGDGGDGGDGGDDGSGGVPTGGTDGGLSGAGDDDSGGCSCRSGTPSGHATWMLALMGLVWARRRR